MKGGNGPLVDRDLHFYPWPCALEHVPFRNKLPLEAGSLLDRRCFQIVALRQSTLLTSGRHECSNEDGEQDVGSRGDLPSLRLQLRGLFPAPAFQR